MSLTTTDPTTTSTANAATDPTAATAAAGAAHTPPGGRVQLALNVRDIDAAVEFYSRLFGVAPAKRRPGYANFAIAQPPLKLVLIEDPTARGDGVTGALNHLGVEVSTSAQVGAAAQRLTGEGLATSTQDATSCCYAVQDKVWVHDPDGAPWEVYTVLADAPSATITSTTATGTDGSGDTDAWTAHGVPTAAAAPAAAAPTSAPVHVTEPASGCCDTAVGSSCCEPSAKASCCGTATATTGDLTGEMPSSCGCR